ncbi:hypothetical protein ACUOCP_54115, partial [Escherichia sp. R-CC3]
HKCSELFTGSVYRLERFRLHPTFHQRDREDADPLINDALIYIRDECIDERKLRGESPETVNNSEHLWISSLKENGSSGTGTS